MRQIYVSVVGCGAVSILGPAGVRLERVTGGFARNLGDVSTLGPAGVRLEHAEQRYTVCAR